MSPPVTSPSHQVSQRVGTLSALITSFTNRAVTPILALTMVDITINKINNEVLIMLVKGILLAKRLIKYVAARASRVFPIAIVTARESAESVLRLVNRAPTKMPGHKRNPKISSAAMAIPVGGQTGLILSCSKASANPTLANR